MGKEYLNPFRLVTDHLKEEQRAGLPREAKLSLSSLRSCFATFLPEMGAPHDITDMITGHVSKKQGINVNKNQAAYQEQLTKSLECMLKASCIMAFANQPNTFNWNDPLPEGLQAAVRRSLPPHRR